MEFATRSVFAQELDSAGQTQQEANAEILATLTELIQSFGSEALNVALTAMPQCRARADDERLFSALRGFAVLVDESDRPKLVARLVGRLVKLEIVTGKRIDFTELGRQYGISKQAISRKMASYAERLDLPAPDSSPSARQSHRLMNRRNHADLSSLKGVYS